MWFEEFEIEERLLIFNFSLFKARQLITENGLNLTSLEEDPVLDVTIDGADEADHQLTLIKGGKLRLFCLFQKSCLTDVY